MENARCLQKCGLGAEWNVRGVCPIVELARSGTCAEFVKVLNRRGVERARSLSKC